MLFKAEFDDGSEIQREELIEFNSALNDLKKEKEKDEVVSEVSSVSVDVNKPKKHRVIDRVSMFDGQNIVIISLSDYSIYVGDQDKEDTLDLELTKVEQDILIKNGCVPVIFSRVTIHRTMSGPAEPERIYVVGFKSGEVERYAALVNGVVEVWKHR